MRAVLAVLCVTMATSGAAFRLEWAGSWKFWALLLGCYAGLAAWAIYRMWDEGVLKAVFKLKSGDFALGAGSALVLLVGSWLGRATLTPWGSEQRAWLDYIYLMVGDPAELQRSVLLTLLLLLVAALEEVVWRAMVLDELMQRFGGRLAVPLSAVLYALSLLPTAYTLRGPAGLNPLLPLAALGCGLVWAFMGRIFGRLPPLMASHMVFTYFVATRFALPGLG